MPAPPYSLHQPALHDRRPANFICGCCFAARPADICGCASRPVPVGSSAGFVRLQRPCSAGCVCLPPLPCHAHCPCSPAPVQFCFSPTPCSCPCAPGSTQQFASCKNCPVDSYNAGLQWRPVHHVASIRRSLCCKDCPVGSRARRLHLRSSCAIVRCSHVKRGRPRTACEQPAKFPTPVF